MMIFNHKTLILSIYLLMAGSAQSILAGDSKQLVLDSRQQAAMGMKSNIAEQVKLVPSAIYPAQATIPLQTMRMLSSPLSGQIIKLNYVHGPIKKDAVIAEIESPDLLKIQETFLANISDLKISQQNFERARQLNQSGVSSTKKLQQARSEVKKRRLKKEQLKKNLILAGMAEAAVRQLEKTLELQPAIQYIKSPVTGQLFDLQVKLGERVAQNQSIISVGETNPIVLIVRVPVAMADQLQEGQQIEVLSVAKSGVIKHIDMMVDPMTQSVDVHVIVNNDDRQLRSGQLFKIRFLTEKKQLTYKISANAISQYSGKTVIFLQQKTGISALPVQVVNITNQQLYFIPKEQQTSAMHVYIQGTTAIKSAMDAANNADTE